MQIGGPQVPNYLISGDGSIIRIKVFDIGPWNMDTTPSVDVTTDIVAGKQLGAIAQIEADTLASWTQFASPGYVGGAANIADIEIQYQVTVAGNIRYHLSRRTGGQYDGAGPYDDPTMNRGTLIVFYRD